MSDPPLRLTSPPLCFWAGRGNFGGTAAVAEMLQRDATVTHVAMVHCETTTGMLNPVAAVGERVKAAGKTFIVDAMSSFGGLPMTMESVHADYLIASANKCIQGTPGFGFIIARISELEKTLKQLELRMAEPGFYNDPKASQPTINHHQTLMWQVGDLMHQWEELQLKAGVEPAGES